MTVYRNKRISRTVSKFQPANKSFKRFFIFEAVRKMLLRFFHTYAASRVHPQLDETHQTNHFLNSDMFTYLCFTNAASTVAGVRFSVSVTSSIPIKNPLPLENKRKTISKQGISTL